MKAYDWILLDADNTLLDFNTSEAKIIKEILIKLGFEPNIENFNLYKSINHGYWKKLEAGEIDIPTLKWKRFEALAQTLGADANPYELSQFFIDTLSQATDLVSNCHLFLSSLSRKHQLGLATNGIAQIQRSRLKANQLEEYFEIYAISEEIGAAKPKAGFFKAAFDKMRYPDPSRVLIIGDSLHADIAGGINYGIDTCWFNPNELPNETSWQPTYEIAELLDIELIV